MNLIAKRLRHFLTSLSIIGISTLFVGCAGSAPEGNASKNETSKEETELVLVPLKGANKWKETFTSKEKIFKNNALGLQVNLDFQIPQAWLDSVKALGYEGVYVNFFCTSTQKNKASSLNDMSLVERVAHDKGQFISTARICEITYGIPYKDLALQAGMHPIQLGYSLHGVNFDKEGDGTLSTYMIKNIEKKVLYESIYTSKALMPDLYNVSITVKKFELETKLHDIRNYDFSVGGSGMPDLYWNVLCGEKITYCAPQIKNTAKYSQTHTSETFYCCEEDLITINFADYDNGPFNTHDDMVGTWKGHISDLPVADFDTIQDKKLSFALIKAKVQK